MQMLYDSVVSYPHPLYSPPKGKVGNRFLELFAAELRMVRERESNSERAMIFPACILRRETGIVKAKAIRRRIERRLQMWREGKIAELAQDVVNTARRGGGNGKQSDDDETLARKYNSMVTEGRLGPAVKMLTNRNGGGVLGPEDLCTKVHRPVIDVLREKHPDLRIPKLDEEEWASFEAYEECLTPIPLDCSSEIVEEVASNLRGGAGPGSVDAIAMSNWLLRHGKYSQMLREELASWTEWLCNSMPPFAAYRALMACRLVALDKQPGVRPLGIGEIFRRAIAKCALKICGEDAKAACGSTNLCAGLEAGIEGAVHSVIKRATTDNTMEFGDWEVDDDIFTRMAEAGEVQDSLPVRRARLAPPGQADQENEVANSGASAEGDEDDMPGLRSSVEGPPTRPTEPTAPLAPAPPAGATEEDEMAEESTPAADAEPAPDNSMADEAGTPLGEPLETPVLEPSQDEVLLLVDAANGFNNLSRYSMLWTVRHRCPKLARFAFNCYRHEIRLVCRRPGMEALILLSKEGVTQGDPLAMALYGIALLPLAEILRKQCPEVLQPWYADDAAMQGRPPSVAKCFQLLIKTGPMFGYYPEPEKSFCICPLATEAAAAATFETANLPLKFSRGHRYVGGFIGSTAMKDRWVEPMVAKWVDGVKAIAKVARKYPQSAFFGFSQSLQSEWQYLCRIVPDVGKHLEPVEAAIQEFLIPALFDMPPGEVKDKFRRLLEHGVKQGGMNIRNPVKGASRLHQASEEASEILVESLLANADLDSVEHKVCVRKAGAKARKERVDSEKELVKEWMEGASKATKKQLERIGECGAWIVLQPNRLNGTCLSAEEWRDNARIRYGIKPAGLCTHCDGCGAGFTIEHGLSCKKGGLVGIRHDDVRDEAGALAAMALTSSKVSYEPTIYFGRGVTASQPTTTQATGRNAPGDDARGDVKIHGLWEKGSDCILDIRITDTDARSYQSSSSRKVLERAAKEKKDKYLDACLERRRSFVPLVYSVDGMACKEAKAFEKRVASLLASKWDRRYSEMVGFVRGRMSLAVIRANTMLLRGARSSRRFCRPEIEDGAGMEAIVGGDAEW